jgi:hypothetical protein
LLRLRRRADLTHGPFASGSCANLVRTRDDCPAWSRRWNVSTACRWRSCRSIARRRTPTLRELHLGLARWHLHRFEHQREAADLDQAIELADGREGPVFWAEAHQFLALLAQGRNRCGEARAHVAHGRRLHTAIGDRAGLARRALYEAGLSDPELGAALALEAVRGARDLGLPRTLSAACKHACLALIGLGSAAERTKRRI